MKGGGMKETTTTSEAPNDDSAAAGDAADVVVDDDAFVGNGSHGDGSDDPVAPFTENEHSQLQKGEDEEPHVEISEGENAEEEYEEEHEQEEEEEEDGDAVVEERQGPVFGDNFYEVEAIRRKRVRKRQVQYLVKWIGWPETDNTWEPLENLASVPEFIEAFEQSLESGQQRKRKRKHVAHHTQIKKRKERSTTPYSLRRFPTRTADNHTHTAPLSDPSLTDPPAFPQAVIFADEIENNGGASSIGNAELPNGSRSTNASELVERNEESDYDPKLSELKAATSNGYNADKLTVQFQEAILATGSDHMDGQLKGACTEPVQSGPCRGAKRRKSGSVKRFKKDSYAGEPVNTQDPNDISISAFESPCTGITDHVGNKSHKNMDHIKPVSNIVKIIKPVGFSPSGSTNIQDVIVTFMAMRSDGTEVMVDNQYLKTFNPILLINFYEQHLRYSPTS